MRNKGKKGNKGDKAPQNGGNVTFVRGMRAKTPTVVRATRVEEDAHRLRLDWGTSEDGNAKGS
jgi:hypothetical protein